jgi:hypothetical protein
MAKEKFTTLQEQIHFMRRLIKAVMEDKGSQFYGAFTDEKVDVMHSIMANLQMVESWILLPDFHAAAMHVLDEAADARVTLEQNGLQFNSAFDILVHILAVVRKLDNTKTDKENLQTLDWVAAMALIGVGRFIVPAQYRESKTPEVKP